MGAAHPSTLADRIIYDYDYYGDLDDADHTRTMTTATSSTAVVLRDTPAPHVARLTLNRPERRNAINPELRRDLRAELAAALEDPAVRSILITGAGATFCAGGDLNSAAENSDPAVARARMTENHRLVRLLWGASKPLVAAVQGWAVGAGAGIALLCDTIVAGQSASFAFSFLRVGLVPDYGLSFTLPRRVGNARARELLLYARATGGADAAAIGLVDACVDDEAVQDAALERALDLARQPPNAVSLTKRMLNTLSPSLESALDAEASSQALAFLGPEHEEGKRAFAERRDPVF